MLKNIDIFLKNKNSITYIANFEISVKSAKLSPELESTASDPSDDGFAQFEESLDAVP